MKKQSRLTPFLSQSDVIARISAMSNAQVLQVDGKGEWSIIEAAEMTANIFSPLSYYSREDLEFAVATTTYKELEG